MAADKVPPPSSSTVTNTSMHDFGYRFIRTKKYTNSIQVPLYCAVNNLTHYTGS